MTIILNKTWFRFAGKTVLLVVLFFTTRGPAQNLPTETSTLFSGSGNCLMCHSAQGETFVTTSGKDISPMSTWRSTMMANSAKDPLWQAKVTAEGIATPHLRTVIEDKCTTCHAPLARTEAIHNGEETYSFEQAVNDPLGRDGVSCTLCHQIQDTNFGLETSFSGHYDITNDHVIFGPYPNPTAAPMFNQTGFTPTHSEHIRSSELCATCHTLFTPYVDDNGEVAGTFPEQTPYLEWRNSDYPGDNIECQTCHMPAVDEPMKIAARPPWLNTKRQPVWKHDFVGGNAYMIALMKENAKELGVTADDVHFDSTMAKEERLLKKHTVELSTDSFIEHDSLIVHVYVKNLAGHKFPTGFPSRRVWLYVDIKNKDQESIFTSGALNADGEIFGLDDTFEPHFQSITREDQVQIYESIMGDVNGQVTYTLLRGATYLKDNRLPPLGFHRDVEGYEHIAIMGAANDDADFSPRDNEGSGSDHIAYKIAATETEFNITVAMYYQTITPRFVADLLAYDSQQIQSFKGFYDLKKNQPILLQKVEKKVLATTINDHPSKTPDSFGLKNHPNPFNSSTFFEFDLDVSSFVRLQIYDITGSLQADVLNQKMAAGPHRITWDGFSTNGATAPSGVYIAVLTTESKKSSMRTVLLR